MHKSSRPAVMIALIAVFALFGVVAINAAAKTTAKPAAKMQAGKAGCPMMGKAMNKSTADVKTVYKGKTYNFCNTACKEKFLSDPAKYSKMHSQMKAGASKNAEGCMGGACPMMGSGKAGKGKDCPMMASGKAMAGNGKASPKVGSDKNIGCKGGVCPLPAPAKATSAKKISAVCPVMGTTIPDVSKASDKMVYKGKTYYFCCPSCKPMFKADPEKYINRMKKK